MSDNDKHTVVVGASMNPSRYAHMAASALTSAGHSITLLSIKKGSFQGNNFLDLRDKPWIDKVDTVTLYIGSQNISQWQEYLLSLKPKRIIFNPGTENEDFALAAKNKDIEVVMGCTLVMLSTRQY